MTTTVITSTEYKNGQRVSEATITVDKSDDLYTLANYQRQYESILIQIAQAQAQGIDTTNLIKERDRIKEALDAQQIIVDGYNT